jgi:5'-deoxynucleotidase YfbR-like HD superfamily hydrolase
MDQDFVLHCIYHDCAEIVTGDLPYPVKSTNRELKRTIEMLEDQTLSKQANYWKSLPYRITPEQYALFKMVEMVEMFEWGLDEMNRGCRYGEIVADRCLKIIYERVSSASKPLPEPWHRLCWYMQNRLGLNEFAIHHEKWWTLEEWKRITECVTSS